ncbi:MAG: Gfo/Idh/MocA family protein, partial [Thermoguttaceae bacterium]
MKSQLVHRRKFLATAAAAVTVPAWIPRSSLAAPGRPGANDRIRVGLIGAGNRAKDLAKESPPDLELVAVADCDLRMIDDYLAAVRQFPGSVVREDCARYQDYREMFVRQKLDGIFIATPTHVRIRACILAMQAGLDVYAEKPLTLTIEEGQHLVRAEEKYATVFQTGTQQRSVAINNFGSDLIRDGAIGKVKVVACPNFPGPVPRPEFPAEPAPAQMDWNLWCDQAPLAPFSTQLHPGLGGWARYREYCGWLVTGWVH